MIAINKLSDLTPHSRDGIYAPGSGNNLYIMKRGRLYEIVHDTDSTNTLFNQAVREIIRGMVAIRLTSPSFGHPVYFTHITHFATYGKHKYIYLPRRGLIPIRYKRVSVYSVIFAHRFLTP